MPKVTVKFDIRNLWVGVRWHYSKSVESPSRWLTVYIGVVPTLVCQLYWHWGWR